MTAVTREELEAIAQELFASLSPSLRYSRHEVQKAVRQLRTTSALRCSKGSGGDKYPSVEAMKAAVELEIHAALGKVQTVVIGQMIQKAIDAAHPAASAAEGEIEQAYRVGKMVGRIFERATPATDAPATREGEAAILLQLLEDECLTLLCQSYPNTDDADVGWEVIEYHMAEPRERVIAAESTPIKALREVARQRPLYAARAKAALSTACQPSASEADPLDDGWRRTEPGMGVRCPPLLSKAVSERAKIIEECARVADEMSACLTGQSVDYYAVKMAANAIRALSPDQARPTAQESDRPEGRS